MMLDDESSRKLLTDCVAVVDVVVGVTRSRRNMPWSSMIGTVLSGGSRTVWSVCQREHTHRTLLVLSPTKFLCYYEPAKIAS